MTRIQEMSLNYHFAVEQKSGSSMHGFFGFNGGTSNTKAPLCVLYYLIIIQRTSLTFRYCWCVENLSFE